MKTPRLKHTVAIGAGCAAVTAAAAGYSLAFNEGRFVFPIDLSRYVFRPADLPMLFAGALTAIYAAYLLILLAQTVWAAHRGRASQPAKTRRIDPRLGLLGILGFLGFVGFVTYRADGVVFPFLFFTFFGFFGFFFEGKMSSTLMDERYRENAQKAQLQALRFGFGVQWLLFIFLGQQALGGSLEHTLIALLISFALTQALVLFLSEFLLYRLDQGSPLDESGD